MQKEVAAAAAAAAESCKWECQTSDQNWNCVSNSDVRIPS